MIEKRKKPKLLRKDWHKKSKLGKRRKKKQIWVRPRGRHNKLREKRKGHGKKPSIGYSQAREIRGKVQGLMPMVVGNVSDLQRLDKEKEIAIFSSVGLKKRIEMAEKAKELGIKTEFNVEKFLEKAKSIVDGRKGRKDKKVQEEKEKKEKAKEKGKEVKEKGKEEKEEKAEEEKKKIMMKPVEKEKPKVAVGPRKVIVKRKALEK